MCPSGRHVYPRTVVSVCYHHTNPTKRVGLVQSGPHHYFIDIAEKIAELALNNNPSLYYQKLTFKRHTMASNYDVYPPLDKAECVSVFSLFLRSTSMKKGIYGYKNYLAFQCFYYEGT
jgi:hypothetical protein